mmetsp:Transcript_32111/g.89459  ORF Transcript_32111/g.89459 Transcript_32111/m.89459 type:complete len:112 (+) Transcript_32111:1-336(+)
MEQLVGMLPKNTQAYFARLKVSCRGWQDMTATTSASKASSTKAASMSQLDRVCVQLAQRRMPIAEIAQVTGMFAESVEVKLAEVAAQEKRGPFTVWQRVVLEGSLGVTWLS